MKKINIYLILGIITFIIFVIFILFFLGIVKTTPSSKTTFSEIKVGEKIFFPHLSQDGQFLYYFGNQGIKLKKFDFATKKTEILYPDDILYINDILWSPDESKLILKNNQPYADTPTRLFDLKTQKITNLNKNIKTVIWSNDGKKIYYQFSDTEKNLNYLAVANYDESDEKKIIDLEYLDYGFIWLNNFQDLGFWSMPQDDSGTKLYVVNLQNNSVNTIIRDYQLNDALSSPNGQYFVYNHFDKDKGITISYAKYDGTSNKDLDYESTVQKIAWSNDSSFFIVAVKEKETENDKFYKVVVKNGKITTLQYSTEKNQDLISAENLMLSPDNKTLYFTSNDILYSLQIP